MAGLSTWAWLQLFWGCHESAPPFERRCWPDGGCLLEQHQVLVDGFSIMRGAFLSFAKARSGNG